MKDKNLILFIFAVIAISVILIPSSLENLNEGSVLGASSVDTTTKNEKNGVTYWYVTIVQDVGAGEEIKTFAYSESDSFESATTSSDEQVSGTISADFKMKTNRLGYENLLSQRTSKEKYINRIYDDGWWFTTNIKQEYSANGIPYYEPKSTTWTPIFDYNIEVNVDGKTFSKNINDQSAPSGTRVMVYDGGSDKAPIYWEEAGGVFGDYTDTAPYISTKNEIITYDNNFVILDDNVNIDSRIKEWNHVMSSSRIDFNEDGEFDEMKDIDKTFSVNNLITNTYNTVPYGIRGTPLTYEPMTSFKEPDFPSYNSLEIDTSGTPKLIHKTNFRVLGTFQIPVEYGQLKIREFDPRPEIGKIESIDLYEQGKMTLEVPVKCHDDAGGIVLQLIGTNLTNYFEWNPETISENFKEGDTKTLEFELKAKDVSKTSKGQIGIKAVASGGQTDIVYIDATIHDIDSEDIERSDLKVIAVDSNGKHLGNSFPIYVSQSEDPQHGEWIGTVVKGSEVEISGEPTLGYTPQTTTVKITENEQTEYLVYNSVGGNSSYGTNFTPYIIALFIIIAIVGLGALGYSYKKKKGKKK